MRYPYGGGGSERCQEGCGCGKHKRREQNPSWKSEGPSTLSGWHQRVYSARGRASEYSCEDCGDNAIDWSIRKGTNGFDVYDYDPRCRACHAKYDYEEKAPKISKAMMGNMNALKVGGK